MKKNENVIGKVIKKYRNYEKLSREKLAEKLNVTSGTIESYEYGRVIPLVEKLKKLHKILDIPFMEFFTDISPTQGYISKMEDKLIKSGAAEILERNPELLEFVKLYGKNSEEFKKDNIRKLLDTMSKSLGNKKK